MWKGSLGDRHQFGRGLMVLAAAIAVIELFSLSYNPKKSILENIYKCDIDIISPTCFDESGNVVTGLAAVWNLYKEPDCRYGLSVPYKSVAIFSSAVFFLGLYFFTAKRSPT
jgi:hypothetical protein